MNYTFNIENFNTFFDRLTKFAGNDNSVESYYRNLFKDNIAKILSTVKNTDLTDDDVYKLNSIIQDILDYKILIKDIFSIVGNVAYNIKDFIQLFYNYTSKSSTDLEKIYTMEFNIDINGSTEKSSVMDMFLKNIKTMDLLNRNVYLIPNIKYRYLDNANEPSFKNGIDAFTSFYSNTNIRDAINDDTVIFVNDELKKLKEMFISSYNCGMFPLFILDIEKTYEPTFVFFKNLQISEEDTLPAIYRNNSQLFNTSALLEKLRVELHKQYYDEVSDFNFRDIIFDPKNYINKLHTSNVNNITINTFAYNLMLAIISQDENDKIKIKEYCREISKFKTYIQAIYSSVLDETCGLGNKILIGG